MYTHQGLGTWGTVLNSAYTDSSGFSCIEGKSGLLYKFDLTLNQTFLKSRNRIEP